MNVVIIGISGRVGSRLANELLQRGHQVTGIARDISAVAPRAGITLKQGDATAPAVLAPLLVGHDAVISASMFLSSNAASLISSLKEAGVPRLLVVGGAGSLLVAPGVKLIATPNFPEAYKAEASAGGAYLDTLRSEKELDWTFLSPSAEFVEGERTGQFRLGQDKLLVSAEGRSWISFEDFAIAFIDELEKPAHSRQRFTVGY